MTELFVFIIGIIFSIVYIFSFKQLPKEKYQFFAVRPYKKSYNQSFEQWDGINYTFYGLFNSISYSFAVATALFLLGSIGLHITQIIIITVLILSLCMPSSKIFAQIVEKKRHVFSVGAASFIGIIFTPWIVYLGNIFSQYIWEISYSKISVLAAITIAYTFGEGIGRLACISFGCCYGKSISDINSCFHRFISPFSMIFEGKTKKIAYESNLDGIRVIPIQAITTIIYTSWGLIALYLFLKGYYTISFILSIHITQIWRFISEFLRADYRGKGSVSVYQCMSLISCIYVIPIAYIFNDVNYFSNLPDIINGFKIIWKPEIIIFLQLIGILSFIYTGKSKVTESKVSFQVIGKCEVVG